MISAWSATLAISGAYAAAGAAEVARVTQPVNTYHLDTRFEPDTGFLAVDGKVSIIPAQRVEVIELLLTKAVQIERFDCGPTCRVEVLDGLELAGALMPRIQRIRLTPAVPLANGESLEVAFRYSGRLVTADMEYGRGVISPGWSELSLGALWYPVWVEQPLLRSTVVLSIPPSFEVIAPGRAEMLGKGRWRLDPGMPLVARISFAASNSWSVHEQSLDRGINARLYTNTVEPRAEAILASVADAFRFFQSILGAPRGTRDMIKVLFANSIADLKFPREAWSSAGDFIVLDQSPPDVQIDTLNHEIAHFWFSAGRPGTSDEFLSESISEYLAMRQGERIWGAAWLAERRAKTAARSAKIDGSILDINGFTANRQPLLYDRGPAALWALHDEIGPMAMDRMLASVHAERVETLDTFLQVLAARHGQATAQRFRELL